MWWNKRFSGGNKKLGAADYLRLCWWARQWIKMARIHRHKDRQTPTYMHIELWAPVPKQLWTVYMNKSAAKPQNIMCAFHVRAYSNDGVFHEYMKLNKQFKTHLNVFIVNYYSYVCLRLCFFLHRQLLWLFSWSY